ncbi:hypothetical protein RvY_05565 [Ramazzottius varieornatus]|uniref:Uncharacterized protein n=1 Tax=Ramazzottius varieornatus TaxID=947166 RepID=A0A1D1V4H5_RAMVA|nr:hypothetical protein RvY_05565 [Ramazzottius varieornatus]
MLRSFLPLAFCVVTLLRWSTSAAPPDHEKPKELAAKPFGKGKEPKPGQKVPKHGEKEKPRPGSEARRSEEPSKELEGLRCYKCDPTEFNNYCRDFKPNLAVPYECIESGKPSKTSSPLSAVVDQDKPYACYKVKGDAAYGHGKIYGAQRYGCGHVVKLRSVDVQTGDSECRNVRTAAKGKDFFDGIVCNCDNADGCNFVSRLLPSSGLILTACYVWLRNH